MKSSEIKLKVMNAVWKDYFNRKWTSEVNSREIELTYIGLKTVCLTLLCAMLSFTFGSYLHLYWEAGGPFTVLSSVASLLWLYFTSPVRVNQRVSLLMITAFFFGASVGFYKYLFGSHQILVLSFLAGITMGIGTLWFVFFLSRERREIYMACVVYSYALTYSRCVVNVLEVLDLYIALQEVTTVLALFLRYLVVYSLEMLCDD